VPRERVVAVRVRVVVRPHRQPEVCVRQWVGNDA
jgi:hypothetical protein